jgi:hypothetical protein
MRTAIFAATLVVFGIVTAPPQAPDPRLSAADVQAVAKVSVHQVAPGVIAGAGPDLNFATADNRMLLMVNFGTAALYDRAKAQKEMKVGNMTVPMPLFHAALAGIGDEAFDSPPGAVQYVIYLKKGAKAASITTYMERGTSPRLTLDQLKTIATLVASRL